jgi:uncharacterized protein (TIGR02646 family)
MRKIKKDLTAIPQSLVVAANSKTHKRRKELIAQGEYIDDQKYNSRYKTKDVLDKLKCLYHNKCAYCESVVEQGHVEHYRPKYSYYWLAYSWDNLLYGCPTCNQYKSTNFDILGEKVTPPKDSDDLGDINVWSSQIYDDQERPKLLNPERDVLNDVFVFDRHGHIKENNNDRADYTIKTCHLDRDFLVDERRKIIEEFENDVKAEYLDATTKEEQKDRISTLVREFLRKSSDETKTFTAYRKAAINWLDDIIKNISRKEE